ncbi:SusC/RagA family TonB-linked outer membrane protein [Moheibacter stercoris]|uniref:TonB-linked SusC/RagA family outer membrane protein n=1 Tax=Moheibacter stercoris TaxID=1628251 RepID=A0ABV2LQK0_9FLAO
MSTKLRGLLVLFGILFGGILMAQEKSVTGTVTDANGFALPDVVVRSSSGEEVYTDDDGKYSIQASEGDTLFIESLGMDVVTVTVGASNTYNATLRAGGSIELEGAVVTALGITRDEKALGYSAQKVDGDMLSASRVSNPLNALSGNVAGVNIVNPSSNLGGSTRITMRGVTSLTQENRPLIVIDGIPMNNSNFNTTTAQRGAGGRDYGDMAYDINPDDIESINVLKGGPAAALYGSRGANGVIMITTKNAKKGRDEIVFNTGFSVDAISLFPDLQNSYGGGYGDTFQTANINGTTYNLVHYAMDESWGPKYDPNTYVLPWNAFDPEFANDYLRPVPWVAPQADAKDFFRSGLTFTNSVAFGKSYENTSARLSLSNVAQKGIVPNSELERTTVNLSVDNKFSDKLTASAELNYISTVGFNRPEVGYGDNSVIQKMFQWGQRQLDYNVLKDYKLSTGEQRTWNRRAWNNALPQYSDNPYWTVYENTSTDTRDRFYGNVKLKYEFMKGLYAIGSVYGDTYSFDINSQVAIGSQAQSGYAVSEFNFTEMNYEGRLHFDRTWGDFSVNSFVGVNRRNQDNENMQANTNGGLIVPNLYNLGNSLEAPTVLNRKYKKRVNSIFGGISLGFKDMLFVDVTGRNDWSSTLPSDNNSYFYPSVSGSFVFSQLMPQNDILNFGKIRGGWGEVRNDTNPNELINTYIAGDPGIFGGTPGFSNQANKKNPFLKPELISTWEVGIEASMFKKRLMFDVTYYEKLTEDLIMAVPVSPATGFTTKNLNSGSMENKGIEALVTLIPVRTNDFEWALTWNFAKNDNMVIDLNEGLQTVVLGSAPFVAQIAAVKGEKWGQIRGSDFVYDEAGNKVVGANGLYLRTPTTNLGSVLPDYNMGLRNTFSYKNLSLSALIDMQKGGKYFSTSNMWGMYSGMLAETAANGIRENGLVVDGVTGTVDFSDFATNGTYTVTNTAPNSTNVDAPDYFAHYYSGPTAQNVFDADYFKLREVTLTYSFPQRMTGPFSGVQLSVYGRNLLTWGLDNDNFDPEMSSTGSGNIQGLEGGNLPPVRSIGMNVRLQF